MRKTIVLIAGCFSLIFAFFHVYLGLKIHALGVLSPDHRALMEMLNVSTALLVFLLAIGSIFFASELLTTPLGRLVLFSSFLLYAMRAIGEVILFPTFKVAIFAVCVLVAGLYLAAFVQSPRNTSPTAHGS